LTTAVAPAHESGSTGLVATTVAPVYDSGCSGQ
jgi:hypothetical protein